MSGESPLSGILINYTFSHPQVHGPLTRAVTCNQRSELFNLDSVVFPSANYWLESMRGYVKGFAVGLFVFSHSNADNIVI